MAKTTTKTAAKPKAASKKAKADAPKARPATGTKTKTSAKAAAKPKATATPKAAAAPKPKAPKPEKGIVRQTSDAISQLASDILHDRIVPTIEQIKSIAASALSQDQAKGKRSKKKK